MNPKVKTAVFVLKKKGIIVYPTETSYGIGCKISDTKSVKKIREIKGNREKPFIVLVSGKEMAKKIGEINGKAEKLMEKFMPGPLTIVVQAKNIPKEVCGKTIAIRISSNEIANEIVKTLEEPLISTSANLSDEKPIFSFKKAVEVFGKKVDFILNAGELEETEPSTIYSIPEKKALRKGKISEKEIEKVLEGKN